MAGNGSAGATFEDELEALGFAVAGSSRRGGSMWSVEFNRFLTFTVHDYGDSLLFTWSFALGDYVEQRGWVIGSGETSFHELFPARDVRLPIDADAVRAEITRVLTTMRIDLGDPSL